MITENGRRKSFLIDVFDRKNIENINQMIDLIKQTLKQRFSGLSDDDFDIASDSGIIIVRIPENISLEKFRIKVSDIPGINLDKISPPASEKYERSCNESS
jgi:hypothetical protein